MRQPSDDEREDARLETAIEKAERDKTATWHYYSPDCGCAFCEPETVTTDPETLQLWETEE